MEAEEEVRRKRRRQRWGRKWTEEKWREQGEWMTKKMIKEKEMWSERKNGERKKKNEIDDEWGGGVDVEKEW